MTQAIVSRTPRPLSAVRPALSRLRPTLSRFWSKVQRYAPTAQQVPLLLFIAVFVILGVDACAQNIDDLSGGAGGKICAFGKSISSSLLAKGICVAVIAWGLLQWLPNRRDGVPQMVGGVAAFIVASKFDTILGFFSVSC